MEETRKTKLGLDENIEGALCYFLGFITGILFLVLDKENKFCRFHAWQSIVTFLPLFVLGLVISWMPYVGWSVPLLLYPLELLLWLILMFKAYEGELFKLPVAGDFAEKEAGKST